MKYLIAIVVFAFSTALACKGAPSCPAPRKPPKPRISHPKRPTPSKLIEIGCDPVRGTCQT